jgi:hypothetical protein
VLLSECTALVFGFPAVMALIVRRYPQVGILDNALIWNLAFCIGFDLGYRALVSIIQMRGAVSMFTTTNCIRALLEIAAVIIALIMGGQSHVILFWMLIARIVGLVFAGMAVASISRKGQIGESAHDGWVRYGLLLGSWFWLQPLFIYIPQWYSIVLQDTIANVAFLASYRVLVQGGLLVTSVFLLYMHPILMNAYEDNGFDSFQEIWVKWLPYYFTFTGVFIVLLCLAYPLFSTVIMTRTYSLDLVAFLCVVPGIFAWSISQFVQKFLEATKRVLIMPIGLALGIMSLSGVLYAFSHRPLVREGYAQTAGLAVSLGFCIYLVVVTNASRRGALKYKKRVYSMLKVVERCGIVTTLFIGFELLRRYLQL